MSREKELEDLIIKYKKAYYSGEPLISDEAYDSLEEELKGINPDNPVLHLVGTPVDGKIAHNPPMLSCKKATDIKEVVKWFNDSDGKDLYFGYKLDGLSLSIIYDDGKLVQAATRGNGQFGDDVTFSVYYIDDIPKIIPIKDRVNIRGEVFMEISEFNRLKKDNLDYSSPRNLATGTLKKKDSSLLKERKLSFMAWWLDGVDDSLALDEMMELIREWGFKTADIKKLTNVDEQVIMNAFREVEEKRDTLDYELDGVMYKYNDAADRKKAGSTSHHPKWQIALKFKSKGTITTINNIIWQVGRTGVLTPVAEVDPVGLAGAEIRRCTLHNADFIIEREIAIGDKVYIERSGDVIPKILEVVEKGDKFVLLPNKCPSCGAHAVKKGVNLVCTGTKCKERELRSLSHWIDVVDIKGLGPKSLEKLFDEGIVTHFSDLYSKDLTEEKLVDILGKNGIKVYKNIDDTRNLDFGTFLSALGIEQLGRSLGKDLAKHFNTLDELQNSSIETLTSIEGISDITAKYILEGINDLSIVDRVLLRNFKIKYNKISEEPRETRGKVYVTGKVDGFNKKEIEKKVKDLGFEWSKSISKNLNYLVAGNNPGGTKIEKALKIGVDILTWNEFIDRFSK